MPKNNECGFGLLDVFLILLMAFLLVGLALIIAF